ncbi:MAG: hypothetical protein ACQCN3_13355 [Candidatus Bathyarchaeia archaeon]
MSHRLLCAFLDVEICSKALLALCQGYGKSPCFSEVAFLRWVGPDYRLSILPCVDGAENMECAICYGR